MTALHEMQCVVVANQVAIQYGSGSSNYVLNAMRRARLVRSSPNCWM